MNTGEFQSLCVTNSVSVLIAALPTLQEVGRTLLVIQKSTSEITALPECKR